jgi:hypothetical protein
MRRATSASLSVSCITRASFRSLTSTFRWRYRRLSIPLIMLYPFTSERQRAFDCTLLIQSRLVACQGASVLVTFSEDEELCAPYRIENRSANVTIEFQQKDLQEDSEVERLGPGESMRCALLCLLRGRQLPASRPQHASSPYHLESPSSACRAAVLIGTLGAAVGMRGRNRRCLTAFALGSCVREKIVAGLGPLGNTTWTTLRRILQCLCEGMARNGGG